MIQPQNSLLQQKGVSRSGTFSLEKQTVLNADLDHSLRYFVVFIILGGGMAAWFSYVFMLLRMNPSAVALLNVAIVSSILLLVMLFQSVLVRSMQLNFFLVLIEAAILPVFSHFNFSSWFPLAAIAFIGFWWIGYVRARVMINEVVRINFWHYSATLISYTVSALAIFSAVFCVGLYQQVGGLSFNGYKFATTVMGVEYALPNFTTGTQLDAFFEGVVEKKVNSSPEFQSLTASDRVSVVQSAAKTIKDNFTSFTKLEAAPGESIVEYTYRVIVGLLDRAQANNYGPLILISIIVGIFFSIKGVMFFVKWPIIFIAFILYVLLQTIGIISIGAEMRQKEVIVVK